MVDVVFSQSVVNKSSRTRGTADPKTRGQNKGSKPPQHNTGEPGSHQELTNNTPVQGAASTSTHQETHRVSVSSTSSSEGGSLTVVNEEPGKLTFADTVRTGEWETPQHMKRKLHKNAKRDIKDKSLNHGLKAAFTGNTATLYIENINIDDQDTKQEIAREVRAYIHNKNNRVLDVYVIFNKYRRDRCGCKIKIPTQNADVLLDDRFWPEGISCRLWEERARSQGNPSNRSKIENGRRGVESYNNASHSKDFYDIEETYHWRDSVHQYDNSRDFDGDYDSRC